MRQQILDDINFIVQNNYRAGNPQFIQETKPSLLKEEGGDIDAEDIFKKPEDKKEKTYKFELTAKEVHTLEMALSVAERKASEVKHGERSAIIKLLNKIQANR